MGQNSSVVLFLIFAAVVALFFGRGLTALVIEAINNFRGGPPTPMHPSPADDGALLRRRSRKV